MVYIAGYKNSCSVIMVIQLMDRKQWREAELHKPHISSIVRDTAEVDAHIALSMNPLFVRNKFSICPTILPLVDCRYSTPPPLMCIPVTTCAANYKKPKQHRGNKWLQDFALSPWALAVLCVACIPPSLSAPISGLQNPNLGKAYWHAGLPDYQFPYLEWSVLIRGV